MYFISFLKYQKYFVIQLNNRIFSNQTLSTEDLGLQNRPKIINNSILIFNWIPFFLCQDLCIYKNKLYNQGDKWDDGCEYSCQCKDGNSGYYECSPK